MQKIAIVGCGGSGKSYLSRQLAAVLGVPVVHLDAVYYDQNWNPLPQDTFAASQQALVAEPGWVIDGNYTATMDIRLRACDTVVLMDISTPCALWGIFSRHLRHGAGQHGDGRHNRITSNFLVYVMTYRRRMRPRVLAQIREHAQHADVVQLTNRRHTRRWLADVSQAISQTQDE